MFFHLLAVALNFAATATAAEGPLAIYNENVYARIWRTALTGPPTINSEDGWAQYTQGSNNNTPVTDTKPGVYINTPADGWTAGFFPDMLWQSYNRRRNLQPELDFDDEPSLEAWLSAARHWTDPLVTNRDLIDTHDLGFLAKPFESALYFANEKKWIPVLQNMSMNLAARFVTPPGVIRSWNTDNSSYATRGSHADSVLVIIDNMMNLALLAHSATDYTHNATLLDIAISHANKTRDNHIREDGSTFHVCDYSGDHGELYLCRTAQGLANNSTWARGQAWAIYGFAQMYSFTGDISYLDSSLKTANYFIEHLPKDGLPFWDFDALYIPDVTPRDSSAATIAASALLLLQEQIDKSDKKRDERNYKGAAIQLLQSAVDLALAGEIAFSNFNGSTVNDTLGADTSVSTPANTSVSTGFESILMHGTANNNPHAGDGTSYDTGLVYGDYYLLEAGNRLLGLM